MGLLALLVTSSLALGQQRVCFMKVGQRLPALPFAHSAECYRFRPLLGEHSTFQRDLAQGLPGEISYVPERLRVSDLDTLMLQPGVYYFTGQDPLPDTLRTLQPLHTVDSLKIWQVNVRRGDNYLGYLSELMGAPLFWAPRNFGHGHLTDQRVAADCVAFVIYGKRRQGFPVRYVGPWAIHDYFRKVPADSLLPGDVLHFGPHVCVLAEDRARPGQLDPEDTLWEALETGPRTIRYDDSRYFGLPVLYYRWKPDFQTPSEQRTHP